MRLGALSALSKKHPQNPTGDLRFIGRVASSFKPILRISEQPTAY